MKIWYDTEFIEGEADMTHSSYEEALARRAGGAFSRKALGHDGEVNGYPTEMAASKGEDWKVPSDPSPNDIMQHGRHWATLRCIGWLDQKGVVWTEIPSGKDYNGGSFTPLLIDARES